MMTMRGELKFNKKFIEEKIMQHPNNIRVPIREVFQSMEKYYSVVIGVLFCFTSNLLNPFFFHEKPSFKILNG